MKQTICPHCGEKKNFHFNYDYAQKHMPIINVLCNECGEFFDNNKEQQKKILIEIMEADANDGLYETKPFNYAFLREITDMYESGDISYGKMVELLNEIAIKWHNKRQ
jgi:hypothetical protein